MKRLFLVIVLVLGASFLTEAQPLSTTQSTSDMRFAKLATKWDEAVPLGNATVGALVWQKGEHLRFSLDRIDLWDLRPIKGRSDRRFDFGWVKQSLREGEYDKVRAFDHEYHGSHSPAPSKLPGAALEFNTTALGEVEGVHLYLNNALCQVEWKSGTTLKTFVHAEKPVGWFVFEGVKGDIAPIIVPPATPTSWADISFENLRARGALLVSATKRNGRIERVVLKAEKSGVVTIKDFGLKTNKRVEGNENGLLTLSMKAGEEVIFK